VMLLLLMWYRRGWVHHYGVSLYDRRVVARVDDDGRVEVLGLVLVHHMLGLVVLLLLLSLLLLW